MAEMEPQLCLYRLKVSVFRSTPERGPQPVQGFAGIAAKWPQKPERSTIDKKRRSILQANPECSHQRGDIQSHNGINGKLISLQRHNPLGFWGSCTKYAHAHTHTHTPGMDIYMQTNLSQIDSKDKHAYLRTYLDTDMQTCIPTYLPTYKYTCIR